MNYLDTRGVEPRHGRHQRPALPTMLCVFFFIFFTSTILKMIKSVNNEKMAKFILIQKIDLDLTS